MKAIVVTRKPVRCRKCKNPVYKILYGEPMCCEAEYYESFGEHVIFGGCCITNDAPEWQCAHCGQQYKKQT